MKRKIALQLSGVERSYGQGDTLLSILKGANLTLHSGEIVALVAPGATSATRGHAVLTSPTVGAEHNAAAVAVDERATKSAVLDAITASAANERATFERLNCTTASGRPTLNYPGRTGGRRT